jgi:hypothetical protein
LYYFLHLSEYTTFAKLACKHVILLRVHNNTW